MDQELQFQQLSLKDVVFKPTPRPGKYRQLYDAITKLSDFDTIRLKPPTKSFRLVVRKAMERRGIAIIARTQGEYVYVYKAPKKP